MTYCLCGSTKFFKEFMEEMEELTIKGHVVLIPGAFKHTSEWIYGENRIYTPENLETFREVHFKKIEMADEVYVIDVGGYIGESTQEEISYARGLGKPVLYYSLLKEGNHSS